EDQQRRFEEWSADMQDTPGALRKLSWALGCYWAANIARRRARRALRKTGHERETPVVAEVIGGTQTRAAEIEAELDRRVQQLFLWTLFMSGFLFGVGTYLAYWGETRFGTFFIGVGTGALSYMYVRRHLHFARRKPILSLIQA